MSKMTNEELLKKYEKRFQGPRYIETQEGWAPLIDAFLTELDALESDKDITIFSIKEKFGLMRIYFNEGTTDEAEALIEKYEKMSAITCEVCGKPGKLRGGAWLRVLCDEEKSIVD